MTTAPPPPFLAAVPAPPVSEEHRAVGFFVRVLGCEKPRPDGHGRGHFC